LLVYFLFPEKRLLIPLYRPISDDKKKLNKKERKPSNEESNIAEGWYKVYISYLPSLENLTLLKIGERDRDALIQITDTDIIIRDYKSSEKLYEWDLQYIIKCKLMEQYGTKILLLMIGNDRDAFFLRTQEAKKLESMIQENLSKFSKTKE